MTQHTYISSIDYINNLTFDYVEMYSFQRGEEFDESDRRSRQEYEKLMVSKDKGNGLTSLEEKRFLELHELFRFTQYLINDKGQFHPSSTKTNTFKSTDSHIDRLISILRTEIIEVPDWMCAPIYRDAIVFYDKSDRIVSTLNICLSCEYMQTDKFNFINGDKKTFDFLRQYFIDLGHKIEGNEDELRISEIATQSSENSYQNKSDNSNIDFIATLTFKTPQQGGRITAVKSGYRPHIKFEFEEMQTSGQQTFIDRELVFPGETVDAEIKIISVDHFANKLTEKMEFEFREGAIVIGTGIIKRIINDKLNTSR